MSDSKSYIPRNMTRIADGLYKEAQTGWTYRHLGGRDFVRIYANPLDRDLVNNV